MIEIDAAGFQRRPAVERQEIGRWLAGHGHALDDVRLVRFWPARAEVEVYDWPAMKARRDVVTRVVEVSAGPPAAVAAAVQASCS